MHKLDDTCTYFRAVCNNANMNSSLIMAFEMPHPPLFREVGMSCTSMAAIKRV